MEATRRIVRRRSSGNSSISSSNRKPLSDCINTINSINSSQSSSSSSTSTKASKSLIKPTQFLSTNPIKPRNDNTSSNLSAVLVNSISTPSRTPKPSSDKGTASGSGSASNAAFEPHSVYSRRQSADKSKTKRKAITEPMSCFPALKTQFTRDEMNDDGVTGPSKSCALPDKKKRCQTTPKEDDAKHALPQDFIERQRAYFAEIDAFELPEEEVASIDELD